MTIQDREAQILRVKASSFHPELDAALEDALRTAVVSAVKTTLETALEEELTVVSDLAPVSTSQIRH